MQKREKDIAGSEMLEVEEGVQIKASRFHKNHVLPRPERKGKSHLLIQKRSQTDGEEGKRKESGNWLLKRKSPFEKRRFLPPNQRRRKSKRFLQRKKRHQKEGNDEQSGKRNVGKEWGKSCLLRKKVFLPRRIRSQNQKIDAATGIHRRLR